MREGEKLKTAPKLQTWEEEGDTFNKSGEVLEWGGYEGKDNEFWFIHG